MKFAIRPVTTKVYEFVNEEVGLSVIIPEDYLHEVTHSLIELIGANEARLIVAEVDSAEKGAQVVADLNRVMSPSHRVCHCGDQCMPGHCINVPA